MPLVACTFCCEQTPDRRALTGHEPVPICPTCAAGWDLVLRTPTIRPDGLGLDVEVSRELDAVIRETARQAASLSPRDAANLRARQAYAERRRRAALGESA